MKLNSADAALLLVALVWGSTFVLVKQSLQAVPPLPFLTLRFLIAAIAFLLFLRTRLNRRLLLTGSLMGAALFSGFLLQTLGLQLTTASNAGFITGLNVVFVPVLSIFLLKTMPAPSAWIGVGLATLGMALLTLQGCSTPNLGDLLVFGCAWSFALHIVLISKYSEDQDVTALCFVQMVTACLLSFIASACLGEVKNLWVTNGNTWISILFLGAVATAGGFLIQTKVQQFTTATRTALIFSLEPVFSAIFASWLLHESFQKEQALGGLLTLIGIIVCELPILEYLKAIKPSFRVLQQHGDMLSWKMTKTQQIAPPAVRGIQTGRLQTGRLR